MPSRWVRFYESENGADYAENLDGVHWIDAPLPRRLHRCAAQSRGYFNGRLARRCACGAIAGAFGPWLNRNSRRRSL